MNNSIENAIRPAQPPQDTGKFRKNVIDQFYTKESVAQSCIQRITQLLPETRDYLWIEPSAGSGAFLHSLPALYEKLGLDIDPKAPDILCADFLTWVPPAPSPSSSPSAEKNIIIFGNPPFGRQSSIAKSFIVKSCKFAAIIAFILPKSFTKPSMFRAFDLKFHRIYEEELPPNSFILNGSQYDVPCVFQIWQKRGVDRAVEPKVEPQGFQYVGADKRYDFVFRRVGALAGKCYKKGDNGQGKVFSPQSHYFIEMDEAFRGSVDAIIANVNAHTFPSNTVGPRSLSKSEANAVINACVAAAVAAALAVATTSP